MTMLRSLIGLLQDDYDPNQPRDQDGKFAKKTVGPVGQYKDLDPKHRDRIVKAREDAVEVEAYKASKAVLNKHGYDYNFQAPKEIADLAWDAEIKVRGSELSKEKDAAEKEERDKIDQDLEDERAIQAATASGHIHPMPTKAVSKLIDHGVTSADEIEQLGNELHATQVEAAKAMKILAALQYDDENDGEDEDKSLSIPQVEDALELFNSIVSGAMSTATSLRTIGSSTDQKTSDQGQEQNRYSSDDSTETPELPELPEYIDPSEIIEDPAKDGDYIDAKKDPGSFEDFCKDNDLDPEDDDEESESNQSIYDDAVAAHQEYLERKEEFETQKQKVKEYEIASKARKVEKVKYALTTQTALEKVYEKQTALTNRVKLIEKEHGSLLKKAQNEVPDEEDLINHEAFDTKPTKDGESFDDPKDQEAWDDATNAASTLTSAESARREEMGVDFDELISSATEYKSEVKTLIRKLAKFTKRPANLGNPKSKAKPVKSSKTDDDDEEQDESISSLVANIRTLLIEP